MGGPGFVSIALAVIRKVDTGIYNIKILHRGYTTETLGIASGDFMY